MDPSEDIILGNSLNLTKAKVDIKLGLIHLSGAITLEMIRMETLKLVICLETFSLVENGLRSELYRKITKWDNITLSLWNGSEPDNTDRKGKEGLTINWIFFSTRQHNSSPKIENPYHDYIWYIYTMNKSDMSPFTNWLHDQFRAEVVHYKDSVWVINQATAEFFQ